MGWKGSSKMRKNLISLFLLGLAPAIILAQYDKGLGGSVYSSFGVGYPFDITSNNFKAQGLLGVSGISRDLTTLSNPALWSRSFFTQASTGLHLSNYTSRDNNLSHKNTSFSSGYIQVLFPVSPGKMGMSLSLYPVTRANFRLIDSGTFMFQQDTVAYNNEIYNSGGINKFEVGFGVKLTNNISFGYAPSVAFITLKNEESWVFSSNSFDGQDQNSSVTGASFSQRLGLSANFNGLLFEDDYVSMGAVLNFPYTISSKEAFTTRKIVGNTTQTLELNRSSGNISLPTEVSFGLGYASSRLLNFAIEGVYQQWSDFDNELQVSDNDLMKDRLKIGFGGQFHPYKRNSRAFLSNFKYSGGVSYDTGHLAIDGNDINTLWINTGLGILSRSTSSVDFSFQVWI